MTIGKVGLTMLFTDDKTSLPSLSRGPLEWIAIHKITFNLFHVRYGYPSPYEYCSCVVAHYMKVNALNCHSLKYSILFPL